MRRRPFVVVGLALVLHCEAEAANASLSATRAGRTVRSPLFACVAARLLALVAAWANAHPAARSDAVGTWNANAGRPLAPRASPPATTIPRVAHVRDDACGHP
jgi:hypothetical protein